jgi:ABC-type bacteriocin/lantibiotic exporter with double-glycine peptidase domain
MTRRTTRSSTVARVTLAIFALGGATAVGATVLLSSNIRAVRAWHASLAGGVLLADSGVRFQRGKTDCGETALAMVFDRHGIAAAPALMAPIQWGREPSQIAELSNRSGLRAEVVRGPIDAIDHLLLPIIALRQNHYILVEAIADRDEVVVVDPGIGRIRFPRRALARGWRGFMITFPTDTYHLQSSPSPASPELRSVPQNHKRSLT